MKKLFSFLAIIGIILVSNCSRIPENNDPVIGHWTSVALSTIDLSQNNATYKEWIFNDVYLGRYHSYIDGELVVISDFNWEENEGTYLIQYPGIENKTNDNVILVESEINSTLKDSDGNTFAIRE